MITSPRPISPLPSSTSDSSPRTAAAMLQEKWEAAADDITATAVLLARRGDVAALRLILERIAPRGRVISLDIPKIENLADVPNILVSLVDLVACGRITSDEADALSSVLDRYTTAVQAVGHEKRLTAIEAAIEESRHA
jgi:hypothetical protein